MTDAHFLFFFSCSADRNKTFTGDEIHQKVRDYVADVPFAEEEEVLCWENDNHAKFAEGTSENLTPTPTLSNVTITHLIFCSLADGKTQTVTSRIPRERSEVVMMSTLLLPGTSIVYYGDELGMADTFPIRCEDTVDAYVDDTECPAGSFPARTRDPARTPMQVRLRMSRVEESTSECWLSICCMTMEGSVIRISSLSSGLVVVLGRRRVKTSFFPEEENDSFPGKCLPFSLRENKRQLWGLQRYLPLHHTV